MESEKRPGGRSARVQAAVHRATTQLLGERARGDLTVPMVAAVAGVTPSTIYRRWGTLANVLADVATERLRPDGPPTDTGALGGDLAAWARAYLEEMTAPTGRELIHDMVAGTGNVACRCAEATRAQVEVILDRARGRGEPAPSAQEIVEHIVSPIIYMILFDDRAPTPTYADELVARLLRHR